MSIHRVAWAAVHDDEIKSAMHGDPLASLDEFRHWVESRAAVLFDFHAAGRRIGCALVSAEQSNGHNQAVIIAGCSRATLPELRGAMRLLIEQLKGFDSIRTHVSRPGLVRLWGGLGFQQTEVVMRREHGQ
ncbi:hypothetical protein [Chitinilyticum aquatile]|uniref:hypothetical protein n=1 Tax=Chitinilyticum aquatile TaxID=362520 RepID=UPI0012DCD89E|nr:hypothetical protein [Chitinilyticum aquatile]